MPTASCLQRGLQLCPASVKLTLGLLSYEVFLVFLEEAAFLDAFFGFACGEKESIDDVIPNAQGPLFTGTDPYRKSQFDIDTWVERGYPRDTTLLYQDTIESQLLLSQ